MKTVRRFKRKVRALQAQKVGLPRERLALQARCHRLAASRLRPLEEKEPG